MKGFFTKDIDWLSKWDDFLKNDNRGNHLLYSDWLKSYNSYGFDFEIYMVVNDEKKIVGGFGAVIAKSLFFKFYIVPIGPIFCNGYESHIAKAVNLIAIRAKQLHCCYAQYQLPVINNLSQFKHAYHANQVQLIDNVFRTGKLFKHVYSASGYNWVDFKNCQSSADLLTQLSVQVRRNIKLSLNNNVTISFAKNIVDCEQAYKIIEKNALENNYSVRVFDDFKETIINLIDKNNAFFMVASINNKVKGCALVVNCGNHLTYITGGTSKSKPDLKMGYLLHWSIIQHSFDLGFCGYNISLGGSQGVKDFKSKFNARPVLFAQNSKYIIVNTTYFKLYLLVNKFFKNHKNLAAKILRFLK